MKKFQRLLDLPRDMKIEGHIDDGGAIALANAHSDAIEAHSDDLDSLSSRVRRLERRSGRDGDELLAALEEQWGCRIPSKPLRWRSDLFAKMSAHEKALREALVGPDPADIILAQQDKLLATLKDPKLRVWTRGIVALMVGALREHGREGRR